MSDLSKTVDRKFVDSIHNDEWEILSNSGWQPITHIHKTVEYAIYTLVLENGYFLKCADNHIVFTEENKQIFVKDLTDRDKVLTDTGPVRVVSVEQSDVYENMYDVTVDSAEHSFYSNGILSHNTTCSAAYLLWEAIFKSEQTILVVSNVFSAAIEIMERIRYSYELLPDWIKPGVDAYNKGSISFDNKSRIISRATTKNSGRGLSLSILYCDELSAVEIRKQREFWAAIRPTLSTGGKCIITSTPGNDEDVFAQIWQGATSTYDEYGNEIPNGLGRNEFKATKFTWKDHPDRDESWEKTERAAMADDALFEREHNCISKESRITIKFPSGEIKEVTISELKEILLAAERNL